MEIEEENDLVDLKFQPLNKSKSTREGDEKGKSKERRNNKIRLIRK